jgi:pyruvate formate lyase activating enzyme
LDLREIGAMDIHIKGFLETTFVDWPGRVASVIFLGGCNFRCPFCHNHGLVTHPEEYPDIPWPSIRNWLIHNKNFIDGVVVTGGEPTLSPGLPELLRKIQALGYEVKLDTNGGRPEVLEALIREGVVRHVAMDVKAPLDDVSYARAAGRPGFAPRVQKSLDVLESSGLGYTLRTTVVPGLHDEKALNRMAGQLAGAPCWNLQKFQPENALDDSFRAKSTFRPEEFEALVRRVQARF